MKKRLINPSEERFYLFGLVILITSISLFTAYDLDLFHADPFGVYILNHACSLIYLFGLFMYNYQNHDGMFRFKSQRYNILGVLIWTVSAYSLNKIMFVFSESVPWLSVWICTYTSALLIFTLLKSRKEKWLDFALVIVLGLAIPFHFYQTLMTVTLYPITVVSFWLFGISMHALIPLFSFFICLKIVRSYFRSSKKFVLPLQASLFSIGILIFAFVYKWASLIHHINQGYTKIEMPYTGKDLPAWCTMGQTTPDDFISRRLLGGIDTYVIEDDFLSWDRLGWEDGKVHDPLVLIASLVSGNLNLNASDRALVAKTLTNKRHEQEWKLWRDDDLVTEYIDTKVQIFPAERMAYTEKTFDIKNNASWKRSQQEALYTFYVPEGSVVTSASLWINGKEELSYLTTKTKADSAYKAIVGRERRDPLLVHWQEGNRVTARIFPVTPAENRKFKIGVTTPLGFKDGDLVYQNIDFKGPNFIGTKEKIALKIEGEEEVNIKTPLAFSWDMNKYQYEGLYYSKWDLAFEAPPLNSATFSFNEKSFRLLDLDFEQKPIEGFKKVYLDVNKSWTKRMFKNILKACGDKQVYMQVNEEIVLVNEKNSMKHFRKARKLNFSLFPIYKIAHPEHSLLISNNDHVTPVIDDLKGSPFAKKLSDYMALSSGKLTLLNLDNHPSQFLNSLVELQSLVKSHSNYDSFIEDGAVLIPKVLDKAKAIHNSKTQVLETMGHELVNKAPDHLMRIHSYNSLMKEIGKDFTKRKTVEEKLISIAEEAHILSPISSMIVLESQADYDRFDIKRKNNSLGNASLEKGGSVPEPHEWLLIGILICALLFSFFKSRLA